MIIKKKRRKLSKRRKTPSGSEQRERKYFLHLFTANNELSPTKRETVEKKMEINPAG